MGGIGSGRRHPGGKDTTSDMRALDVRRLQRDGLLTPGRAFGWQWTRDGDEVASIQIRTEADHMILNYRSRSNGGEWQPISSPSATTARRRERFLPASVPIDRTARGAGAPGGVGQTRAATDSRIIRSLQFIAE